MKKILFSFFIFASIATSAQVGIGVSTANVHPSAQLDVTSTTKGFLPPRMNEAQKNAIINPANGLLVYQTDGLSGFYYYEDSVWKKGLGTNGANGDNGAVGMSAYQAALSNGYTGTEAEWITSLTGVQGPQGTKGDTGAIGETGATGANGINGNDGAN